MGLWFSSYQGRLRLGSTAHQADRGLNICQSFDPATRRIGYDQHKNRRNMDRQANGSGRHAGPRPGMLAGEAGLGEGRPVHFTTLLLDNFRPQYMQVAVS
jgi:hypothetical protein